MPHDTNDVLGYTIDYDHADQYILCHRCKLRSFNRGDIHNRYCGNCHKFHDEELLEHAARSR